MKKLGIVLLIALLVVAAYWLYFKKLPFNLIPSTDSGTGSTGINADEATATKTGGTVNGSFVSSGTVVKDNYGFPLSEGSTGKYVSNIQQALNDRFGSNVEVDGIFGSETAKALSAHGFNPTAIYWKHYFEILGIKN